jgi:hypothetical protein
MQDSVQTSVPLVDLGSVKAEWAGIWSPGYQDKLIQSFISKQFLEEAPTYASRYNNAAGWMKLIQDACRDFTLGAAATRSFLF